VTISREVLAARLDELLTEDNLRQGMKEYIEGKKGEEFDPEVHTYRMDDALYAGSDMTPAEGTGGAGSGCSRTLCLMRLDAEAAPSMQRIRDALLSVRQSTGLRPLQQGLAVPRDLRADHPERREHGLRRRLRARQSGVQRGHCGHAGPWGSTRRPGTSWRQ
jgi:hypothetical protein